MRYLFAYNSLNYFLESSVLGLLDHECRVSGTDCMSLHYSFHGKAQKQSFTLQEEDIMTHSHAKLQEKKLIVVTVNRKKGRTKVGLLQKERKDILYTLSCFHLDAKYLFLTRQHPEIRRHIVSGYVVL